MKLSELMAGYIPKPDFEGFISNDDWVLAIDIAETASTSDDEYIVAQMGVAGLDAQLNPITQDKQYIRAGMSTLKTGTQRTFALSGDRYVGDPFQDFCFQHKNKFGIGQMIVKPYVYFNVLNGKCEKGQVSIIVNSDGSGNAGESSAVSIDCKKTGALPVEYSYKSTSGGETNGII